MSLPFVLSSSSLDYEVAPSVVVATLIPPWLPRGVLSGSDSLGTLFRVEASNVWDGYVASQERVLRLIDVKVCQ